MATSWFLSSMPSIGFGFLVVIVIFWRLRAPPFFEFGLIPVPMLDRCVEDSIQKSTPPAATSKHAWPTTDRQTNKLSLFTNWSVRLMRYKIQWDMEFVCPTDRQTDELCCVHCKFNERQTYLIKSRGYTSVCPSVLSGNFTSKS